jgi:hypothetical protein
MYNHYTYDKALLGADIERGPKAWLYPRAPLGGETVIARGQMLGAEVDLERRIRSTIASTDSRQPEKKFEYLSEQNWGKGHKRMTLLIFLYGNIGICVIS